MYNFVDIITLATLIQAMPDVRLDPKQAGTAPGVVFREPDTFGYQGLVNQKRNNFDQFLRSNIDNEANKRNAAREVARDMLPCRQDQRGPPMQFTRGVAQEMPLRWNNPHDSDCEVNVFVQGMAQVAPIKRPFNCGGGYQDQRFTFTIPTDFPGCETAAENCVLQIYGHSVEPRTYAMCIDFTLRPGAGAPPAGNSTIVAPSATGVGATTAIGVSTAASTGTVSVAAVPTGAAGKSSAKAAKQTGTAAKSSAAAPTVTAAPAGKVANGLVKRQASRASKDVLTTQFQPAIHFHDSFDTSHVDSAYSGYRGQQGEFIRDELKAAIQLQSFVPNGGLVPLGDIDKRKNQQMRDQVQNAIKAAEKLAIVRNKAEQARLNDVARQAKAPRQCFEGELYGVVNNPSCRRQFTNTYVTNVGYRQIFNQFLPRFIAGNFTQYVPRLKTEIGVTAPDPFGQFRVNGRPSLTPQGQSQRGAAAPQPAPPRVPGPEPQQLSVLSSRVAAAPVVQLPTDIEGTASRVNETVPVNPDDKEMREEDKTPQQRVEQQRELPSGQVPGGQQTVAAPQPTSVANLPAPQAPQQQAPAPQQQAPQAPQQQAPAPQPTNPLPGQVSTQAQRGVPISLSSLMAQLKAVVTQMDTEMSKLAQ